MKENLRQHSSSQDSNQAARICKSWQNAFLCIRGCNCRYVHPDNEATNMNVIRHLDFLVSMVNNVSFKIDQLSSETRFHRGGYAQSDSLQQRASPIVGRSTSQDRWSQFNASPSSAIGHNSQRTDYINKKAVEESLKSYQVNSPGDLMGIATPQGTSSSHSFLQPGLWSAQIHAQTIEATKKAVESKHQGKEKDKNKSSTQNSDDGNHSQRAKVDKVVKQ
uniref:C3H1-type domain-containing protein n=1 Tax=Romanomermis culicivorax TaxID=13658 RepID=A0A915LBG7_ROMCU